MVPYRETLAIDQVSFFFFKDYVHMHVIGIEYGLVSNLP